MELKNLNTIPPLIKKGKIDKSRLSQTQYTVSLLHEGLRVGLLNSQEVYAIQSQFMLTLKDLIRRYTQGKSSSVTTETASSILTSILYAINAYTLRFNDPEKAITYLKTANIREIYEKGVDLVRQCFEETKQLYKKIKRHKLDVAVDAYNLTIDESIPAFLKKYGIIFDAHNTMASIDYPLAIDDMRIQGVFYIRQYLERLKMETEFCSFFNKSDLQAILLSFGRTNGFDYRIELFNIFQLMLNNAIFSVLSKGNANEVRISIYQYRRLEHLFTSLDASQIRLAIYHATDQLLNELNIKNPKLKNYINLCTKDLIQRVINAAHYNSLQSIIMTERDKKPKTTMVSFQEADGMSDSRFRLLVEEIMKCQKTKDKIQIIQTSFHSLKDYVDVLNANCLFDDEYKILFQTFGDMELAILAKMVFYEELRMNPLDLSSFVMEKKEMEHEWQKCFVEFIQGCNRDQINSIEKCMQDIDYEEIKFY